MERIAPQPPASVRVRHGLGDAKRPTTLIEVGGEHDFEHREVLSSALDAVDGHVVVDLTLCRFVDKVVIGATLGKALELGKRGHRLELVVPPSGPLARTVDVLGLRRRELNRQPRRQVRRVATATRLK